MKRNELTHDLVWQEDGHLADPAIVVMADGQDVLPPAAHHHVDACDECARRVGAAALASVATGESLTAPAREPSREITARPLPTAAVLGALALAAAGIAPLAIELPRTLPVVVAVLMRAAPIAIQSVLSLSFRQTSARAVLFVSVACLVTMVVAALAVARLTPREASKQGVIS